MTAPERAVRKAVAEEIPDVPRRERYVRTAVAIGAAVLMGALALDDASFLTLLVFCGALFVYGAAKYVDGARESEVLIKRKATAVLAEFHAQALAEVESLQSRCARQRDEEIRRAASAAWQVGNRGGGYGDALDAAHSATTAHD